MDLAWSWPQQHGDAFRPYGTSRPGKVGGPSTLMGDSNPCSTPPPPPPPPPSFQPDVVRLDARDVPSDADDPASRHRSGGLVPSRASCVSPAHARAKDEAKRSGPEKDCAMSCISSRACPTKALTSAAASTSSYIMSCLPSLCLALQPARDTSLHLLLSTASSEIPLLSSVLRSLRPGVPR